MEHQQDPARKKSNRSPPYALFNLLVIVTAVCYAMYYNMYLSPKGVEEEEVQLNQNEEEDLVKIPMFTAEQLAKFDGISEYPDVSGIVVE